MTESTANYCSRVFPPPWRILGLRLHPFTLGHAHLLAASTAWRPLEPYDLTDQLFATGLYLCTRPWREARVGSPGAGWFAFRLAIRGRLARVNLVEKARTFAEFLDWNSSGPVIRPMVRVERSLRPSPTSSRSLGSPLLARLRVFAPPFGGLDALFGDVLWLWSVYGETHGNFRVLNGDEQGFDDFCEAQDSLRN